MIQLSSFFLPKTRVVAALSVLVFTGAVPSEAQDAVRVVSRAELVEAMRREADKKYNLLATPNGARFSAGVIFQLVRRSQATDSNRTPLLVRHSDFFHAFLEVTAVAPDKAPVWITTGFAHREDLYLDYRRENVIQKIIEGPAPEIAVNVVAGWRGDPDKYTYVDSTSDPPLRVSHERITSYRLLDFGEIVLYDDINGVSGRALGGLLGLLFRFTGDAEAVKSSFAISGDGVQVTVVTGRKGPFVVTTTATVFPNGRADKGLPPNRRDLAAIQERLKRRFVARYAPIRTSRFLPE